jgi:hypothetical protein
LDLRIPLSSFVAACTRHNIPHVYLHTEMGETELVGWSPTGGSILSSSATPRAEIEQILTQGKIEFSEGRSAEAGAHHPMWVAAVAYRSRDDAPGLWVDALPHEPRTGDVLERFHRELTEDGEMVGLTLAEFLNLARPTVVVLSPEEQSRFAASHENDAP